MSEVSFHIELTQYQNGGNVSDYTMGENGAPLINDAKI